MPFTQKGLDGFRSAMSRLFDDPAMAEKLTDETIENLMKNAESSISAGSFTVPLNTGYTFVTPALDNVPADVAYQKAYDKAAASQSASVTGFAYSLVMPRLLRETNVGGFTEIVAWSGADCILRMTVPGSPSLISVSEIIKGIAPYISRIELAWKPALEEGATGTSRFGRAITFEPEGTIGGPAEAEDVGF
jgi:hypothetical protein